MPIDHKDISEAFFNIGRLEVFIESSYENRGSIPLAGQAKFRESVESLARFIFKAQGEIKDAIK